MWPFRFFTGWYFAARYWSKIGAQGSLLPGIKQAAATLVKPIGYDATLVQPVGYRATLVRPSGFDAVEIA